MRSEAQAQGEGSGPLGSAGDGDGDAERPRKRPRVGRHTEEEEGRDYVCGRCGSAYKQWYSLVWHTRTHQKRYDSEAENEGRYGSGDTPLATITPMPILPNEVCAKTVPHNAPAGEAWPTETEARHNSLKVECRESAAHLLECPSLRELRKKHGLETLKDGELFFSAQLASFLKELFKLESPSAPTPDEPKLRPARAVKRHRSPTELDTTYPPSAVAKRIGVCTARGMRKRVREADSPSKAICFKVPLDEARMRSGLRSTSPAGLQSRGAAVSLAQHEQIKSTMKKKKKKQGNIPGDAGRLIVAPGSSTLSRGSQAPRTMPGPTGLGRARG
ncbi:hypothetical protein ERJ75_000155100 [Trypanosoma vivax]|nr:hypothetical protein ERJ75_000155100 [Trypanosoma vivax]